MLAGQQLGVERGWGEIFALPTRGNWKEDQLASEILSRILQQRPSCCGGGGGTGQI